MGVLEKRVMTHELMDAPDLDAAAHAEALAGLSRLNRAARAVRQVARPILALARETGLKKISVLDVACGGGDVSVGVASAMRQAGVEPSLTLMDMSTTALGRAKTAADAADVAARTVQGSAPFGLPWNSADGEEVPFDVVTCTLFLHHLSREDVVETLWQMSRRARRLLVVADLRRSAVGFGIAWVMCRLLSRSRIVHFDGPVSVRAAWSLEEMREMALEARVPATELRVQRCWPWRIMVTWRPA